MPFQATRRHALLAAALTGLAAPRTVRAQEDYPARPVKIIVPFPPGQAADTVVRMVADELSRRWPHRVLVENRAGGAGVPAIEAGARAAPDGYTLTNGTSGTFGVNPGVLPRLPYDPERDFAAITNLTVGPLIVICHPSFPAQTMQELAAAARRAAAGGADDRRDRLARLRIRRLDRAGRAGRDAARDRAEDQRRCGHDPARPGGGGADGRDGLLPRSRHA
jgi:tripartite-type tricarboxylate transporter receptor subunit TctC